MLKSVKDKVKPDLQTAKAIRTIREGRDGSMVVVLENNDQTSKDDLKKELLRVENITLIRELSNNEASLIITDIDGDTSKNEVKDRICEEMGWHETTVQIGELRQTFGDNSSVTVKLPRNQAKTFLKKEKIRIGLSLCPIKERVEVIRCFRC